MPTVRRKQTRHSEQNKSGVTLTKGQLNRIIDTIFHRHFRKNPDLIFIDGFAHAVVENNPEKSLRKFLKYGLPALLKETEQKKKRRQLNENSC